MITDFLPSTSGLHFPNSFPHVPVRRIGIPGVISVPIGDASDGLCGGMVFAARDYFEAGRPPPVTTAPPVSGPLFDYVVRRLVDSFNLPRGPLKYLELMNPALPDGESILSRLGLVPHGRAWRMIAEEWPRIRSDIDGGRPPPIGLVKIKSVNPFELKRNHQVLAYGYDLRGVELTLHLYDPNRPDDDGVTMSLSVADPRTGISIGYPSSSTPVYAFFRIGYRPATPP